MWGADHPELLRSGLAACWSHPSSFGREILRWGDSGWGKLTRISHPHSCSSFSVSLLLLLLFRVFIKSDYFHRLLTSVFAKFHKAAVLRDKVFQGLYFKYKLSCTHPQLHTYKNTAQNHTNLKPPLSLFLALSHLLSVFCPPHLNSSWAQTHTTFGYLAEKHTPLAGELSLQNPIRTSLWPDSAKSN